MPSGGMPDIGDLVRQRLDAIERGDEAANAKAKAEFEKRLDATPGARERLEFARQHAPITGRESEDGVS